LDLLKGVALTKLKIILNPKGDIFHVLNIDSPCYSSFGEVYFSTINEGCVKGWKKHIKMSMNIVVPVGIIKIVLYDDRKDSFSFGKFYEIELSKKNYCRLTIPNGIWMSFMGISPGENILMNFANIKHDPFESINLPLNEINYKW